MDATGPRLPDPLAERLLRVGYIKMTSRGVLRRPLYASAEQTCRVDNGAVHLSVGREDLAAQL